MRLDHSLASLLVLPVALLCACATGGGSSSVAPFPGREAYLARVKEIGDKQQLALDACKGKEPPAKNGFFEITADASGKLAARKISWEGAPELEACILDTVGKATLAPLAGPPTSNLWEIGPPGSAQPAPPDPNAIATGEMQAFYERMQPEVDACAQRYLPPEQPTDIEISVMLFGGGKPYCINVSSSTAKDGSFETCVQQLVGGHTLPDPRYDGAYNLPLHFHVGRPNVQM